uniref:ogr/Delta-like zinc finger family protein n=1 Tax=Cellvibrio fontiphilus TaxID=1815559 RepID=UPI0038991588
MADKNNIAGRQCLRLTCPHCNSAARIRHSRALSPLYRDGIIECQNVASCGWRGRFGFEYLATLTPSAQARLEITLPLSPYVLPVGPHALPASHHPKTKNPLDPHRDQLPLFG